MFAGRITVAVRPTKSGKTTLYDYADGLRTAVLEFEVSEKQQENSLFSQMSAKNIPGHTD